MVLGFAVGLVALIVAELYVIVQAVHLVGVVPTVALLVVIPMLGIRIVKREGLTVYRRFQESVAKRELPGAHVLDGLLLLVAGVCLMTPGFITDALGLLLLLPRVRAVVRGMLRWMLVKRVAGTTIRFYQ